MDFLNLAILCVASYTGVLIIIGWYTSRNQDHAGFIIGNRQIGALATAASIGVGWRDIAFMTFWLSMAYQSGWGLFTVCIGSVLSMWLLAHLSKPLKQIAAKRNYITPGQMLEDHIGPMSRKTYSFIVVFISGLLGAAQLLVMGTLLSSTIHLSPMITVPVVACVVGFYLWQGGYKSVILTDFVQFVIVLALILIPFFIPLDPGHAETIFDIESLGSLGWAETLTLIIFPFFWNIPAPDVWQRIYSAKSVKAIKIGLPIGALMFGVLTFGLVYIGIFLREALPNADPNMLFTLIFTESVFSPLILSALLVIVFAMGMSTLDTWTFLFSSTILRDFMHTRIRNNRETYIKNTRIIMACFLIITTFVALLSESLLTLLMGFVSSYAIAAPMFYAILLKGIHANRKNDLAISGITIISFIIYGFMHFTGLLGTSFVMSIIPAVCGTLMTALWVGFQKFRTS